MLVVQPGGNGPHAGGLALLAPMRKVGELDVVVFQQFQEEILIPVDPPKG